MSAEFISRVMIDMGYAAATDSRRIAEIQVEGWRAAYRGLLPDAYLAGLDVDAREKVWTRFIDAGTGVMLVSRSAGRVEGFCHLIPSRDPAAAGTAEIAAIYVDPPCWRQGHGRVLVEAALAAAAEQGNGSLTLWVLAGNAPGRRFYEAMGMHADGGEKTEARLGFDLHEVRYRIPLRRGHR